MLRQDLLSTRSGPRSRSDRRSERNRIAGLADLADLAAAYAFGIVRSHPFVDGNKRTAFVAAQIFLGLNAYEIEVQDEDVVDTTFRRLAAADLFEERLAVWIR